MWPTNFFFDLALVREWLLITDQHNFLPTSRVINKTGSVRIK